jgi:hypothetical protein
MKRKPAPEQSVSQPSRCKKCGSTRREPYHGRKELEFSGQDKEGKPFTHVVWRRTSCSDCGQARVDRHYENRPQKENRPRKKGR